MPSPRALPIDARRVAWDQLWAKLLTQPPQDEPNPDFESEPAGEPDIQQRQGGAARRRRSQERQAARKEVTALSTE